MKKLAFGLALVLSTTTLAAQQAPAASQAVDPTGTWAIEGTPWSIVLKLEGATLTGKVVQGAQEFEIKEGKLEGSTVSFKASVPTGERTMTFVGKITGNDVEFKRTVEIKEGGAPGGVALMGAGGPSEFKAHRSAPDTDVWTGTVKNGPNANNPNPNPNPRPVTVSVRQLPDPHWRWRGGSKETPTRVLTLQNQVNPINTFTVEGDRLTFTYSLGPQANPWTCALGKQTDGQFLGVCRPDSGNQNLILTLTPPKEGAK